MTLGALLAATVAIACSSPYSASDDGVAAPNTSGERRNDAGVLEGEEAGSSTQNEGGPGGTGEAGSASTADLYRAAVLADGPHAYWRLNETTGLVASDLGPTKLDAAYQGACTQGVPGPFPNSTAIELAGACEVRAPSIDFAQQAPFTLEIWAKPRAIGTSHRRLFGHGVADAQGYQHIGLYFRDPVGTVFERSIDNQIVEAKGPLPTLGSFVHVVAVYSGVMLTLYVNGAPVATGADARSQVAKSTPFWIGSNGDENFFDGTLAEAAVYAKALSATQIANHYAVGTKNQ